MRTEPRSRCPINLSLEVFGDRWTLLVLRDMIFGGRRHFRELLDSEEGISSNILADRLRMLLEHGLITKAPDPTHKQKVMYSLTEQGICLVPIYAQIGAWGLQFLPVSRQLGIRMEILTAGGPPLWNTFMDELREIHRGSSQRQQPQPDGPSVHQQMAAAYDAVVGRPA
jgi:DNA-binding HxlR family transcriptional regulator